MSAGRLFWLSFALSLLAGGCLLLLGGYPE